MCSLKKSVGQRGVEGTTESPCSFVDQNRSKSTNDGAPVVRYSRVAFSSKLDKLPVVSRGLIVIPAGYYMERDSGENRVHGACRTDVVFITFRLPGYFSVCMYVCIEHWISEIRFSAPVFGFGLAFSSKRAIRNSLAEGSF